MAEIEVSYVVWYESISFLRSVREAFIALYQLRMYKYICVRWSAGSANILGTYGKVL